MTICTKSLQSKVSSFIDLADMLETYTGLDKNKFLSEDEFLAPLIENDILWFMAEQCGMPEDEMKDWIWDHTTQKVKCSIVEECGPAGWPVIEVECLDKKFFFDWAE